MADSIFNGLKLPLFGKGKKRPSPFSAKDLNRLVEVAEALCNPEIVRGSSDQVVIGRGRIRFQLEQGSGTGARTNTRSPPLATNYPTSDAANIWDGCLIG